MVFRAWHRPSASCGSSARRWAARGAQVAAAREQRLPWRPIRCRGARRGSSARAPRAPVPARGPGSARTRSHRRRRRVRSAACHRCSGDGVGDVASPEGAPRGNVRVGCSTIARRTGRASGARWKSAGTGRRCARTEPGSCRHSDAVRRERHQVGWGARPASRVSARGDSRHRRGRDVHRCRAPRWRAACNGE